MFCPFPVAKIPQFQFISVILCHLSQVLRKTRLEGSAPLSHVSSLVSGLTGGPWCFPCPSVCQCKLPRCKTLSWGVLASRLSRNHQHFVRLNPSRCLQEEQGWSCFYHTWGYSAVEPRQGRQVEDINKCPFRQLKYWGIFLVWQLWTKPIKFSIN